MASLLEYFVKDGAQNLTSHETWPLKDAEGVNLGEVIARLHFDFDANAKYISFFVPEMPGADSPENLLLNEVAGILRWSETKVGVQMGFGDERRDARELAFTGRIYFYSDRPVSDPHKAQLNARAKDAGQTLIFRSAEYAAERNKWEKPRAFISHDSRDKKTIAEPIALQLEEADVPSLVR